MKAVGIKGKFLEFKGQPLVRIDNELYYGDMSEKFYLFMMIMNYKSLDKFGTQVPDKVMIQILPTSGNGKVEKQNIVTGLSEALDLGIAWLERANRT